MTQRYDLWADELPLVLASTSQTRRALLDAAGLPVEAVAPNVDERALERRLETEGADASTTALELASAKGSGVVASHENRWIVAADQTLECDGVRFHKPSNATQAGEQLRSLSGRTHYLHSGFCVFHRGACLYRHVDTAALTMRSFSDTFLDAYLKAAGPTVTSSVGAYQVEGLGVHLFEKIDGAHSTILGLPVQPLLAFFRSAGAVRA